MAELSSELIGMRATVVVSEVRAERMELSEDSVCPICHEEIKVDSCLSYCKEKCGNNFHLECLRVWAEHKAQEGSAVNCPMCRAKFPNDLLLQLQSEEEAFARKQYKKRHVEFNCGGCGVDIPVRPHKCLLCSSFELCEGCYAARKHIKHPFIVQGDDGRWRGAE